MTPASQRTLGNLLLAIGIVILVISLSGMLGLTPKLTSSRDLNVLSIVLVVAAGALRRKGKEPVA